MPSYFAHIELVNYMLRDNAPFFYGCVTVKLVTAQTVSALLHATKGNVPGVVGASAETTSLPFASVVPTTKHVGVC